MMNLLPSVGVEKVAGVAAAATSDVESDVIDMQDARGVMLLTSVGTPNAGTLLKVQQGDLADGSDMVDVAGQVAGKRDMVLDVYHPEKRYLRAVVVRAAATTVENIWAIAYGQRVLPPVRDDVDLAAVLAVSPS